MLKRLLRRPGVQLAATRLIGRYLRFTLATTRWTLDGAEHLPRGGDPVIAAFWHECLPLMPALLEETRRRGGARRPSVLVSRHNDGRMIGEIMRLFGADVVHGSSGKRGTSSGGAAGMRGMLATLRSGEHVVITPDGPRGPRRRAAPGVARLAALGGAPILPMGANARRRLVLGTWDRMQLPLPWGRGALVCLPPIEVPRAGWEGLLPRIEAALSEAAERARALS